MSVAVVACLDELQRLHGRLRKIHRKAPGAKLAAEVLAEQRLHVGFVVDDEDEQGHAWPPDCPSLAALRGSTILNSVNSPSSVSTSMVPECCLTMMSWLSESPRPVPSPAGFVVKNGSNILSRTSRGMPLPLSRMRISTLSPRFLVAASRVGS